MFMNFPKLFIYNSNYSTFCAFGENIVQTLKKTFQINMLGKTSLVLKIGKTLLPNEIPFSLV